MALEDGVARLRLQGSCHGCGASQTTLELAIEEALQAAAPDLLGLEVEGVVERPPTARPVASSEAGVGRGAGRGASSGRFETLLAGGLLVANVAGHAAGLPRHLRVRRAPGRGDARRRHAALRRLRAVVRPAARRALRRATTPCSWSPCRCCAATARSASPSSSREERPTCELCPSGIGEHHRHLLHLDERRILCVCETCWSVRSGDPEFRPPGARTVWLDDVAIPDHVWAAFQIPIGLAFMIRSSVSGGIVALYPSPAGATESELDLAAWDELVALHPELDRLEPDAEALVVNRMASPAQHAIVPVDQAYRLVGLVKERWEGISGGRELEAAVAGFFDDIRGEAVAA